MSANSRVLNLTATSTGIPLTSPNTIGMSGIAAFVNALPFHRKTIKRESNIHLPMLDSSNNVVPSAAPTVVSVDDCDSLISSNSLRFDLVSAEYSLASKLNVIHPYHPSAPRLNSDRRVEVIAHRGALYDEPENTLQAFRKAAELGADAVELDVFLLPKCGTLIVFHGYGSDENPGWLKGYCTQSEGNILDLDYEQVQNLTFDNDGEEFACGADRIEGSKIPKLEDVLNLAKQMNFKVTIELKGPGTEIVVDRETMRPTHRYKTGCLFVEPPPNFVSIATCVGASEVHLKYDSCTKDRIEMIHAAGMDSMAWFRGHIGMYEDVTERYKDVGNEDELMYKTVIATGVRKLCVNRPDMLV
eukprot:CAMPEP_0116075910 /NCGR_PEP_ID=MMETSP0322-20121206/16926_1 /TAXON_ID=163516 /ORGANISM="Leptocylindrus danicus var. apora, Strain B651" /LENGTH=357 /DNA_ID=CAMNT_0003566079 /DNA_START=75 /DNA_END=1146 /DNA_ORIENTATION=+